MTTGNEQQVAALEKTILDQARGLAAEYLAKASQQRDIILRDAAERLRVAEERETLAAKAAADRLQRRHVQASELKIQSQLDQLRWELTLSVQSRLAERMRHLRDDRAAYQTWLTELVCEGAQQITEGELIAEVDAEDLEWLPAIWPRLVEEAAPGRMICLSNHAIAGSGGVRLRTVDRRIQLDNRFEGRLARLESGIQRRLVQQLFPHEAGVHSAL